MKDSLEYLNDVEIDLTEYDEQPLNDIEKQKMKRNFRASLGKKKTSDSKRLLLKASTIVALLAVGVVSFGVCFPTYADKIPGLKEVISFLNRNNDIDGYEEVSTPIVSSKKGNGYEINIESAYYNKRELTIFYNVTGDEKLDQFNQYYFDINLDLENPSSYEYSLEYGEFIDEYTYAGMLTIYIRPHDGSELPEVLNCKVDFTKLYTDHTMNNFIELEKEPIELSLDSSNIEVKEYEINKKIVFNNNSVEITKVEEYPTGIFVESKNNSVNVDESLDYILWDSNKGELGRIAGRDTDNGAMSWQYRLPGENSEVYLIPYVYIYDKAVEAGEVKEIKKELISLEKSKYDLGKDSTVEILDIYDKDGKTFMKVRTTGIQSRIDFYLKGDDQDEYYAPIYVENKNILGVLDMEATYVFNKLDKEENYYIEKFWSPFTLLEEQIIKIK